MAESDQWWDQRPPARRGKPWYRARNVILITILALLVWCGVFFYQVIYAKPVRSVDYGAKVAELVRREQRMPEDAGGAENGWVLLRDLVNKVTPLHAKVVEGIEWGGERAYVECTVLYDPSGRLPNGATREQTEALAKAYIAALREAGAFTDLQKLTTLPFAAREPQRGILLAWFLPELGGSRNLARANTARMVLAHRAGDEAERRAAMEQSLAIAQLVAKQHTLIDHLVGLAISALTLDEMRRELIERPPTEEEARALLAIIDRRLPLPPMATAMEGERLGAMDAMQTVFSDTGNGNGRLLLPEFQRISGGGGGGGASGDPFDQLCQYKVSNLAGIVLPGRKATTARLNEFYDAIILRTKMSRPVRMADPFNADLFYDKVKSEWNLFAGIILPAIGKAQGSRDQHDLDLAGTRLMLAIELHRARTGGYPASLAELVPGEIAEVPLDPFTGKAFGYKLFKAGEDPDGAGRGYLLYSFAGDGADNGGAPAKTFVDALHSPRAGGTDYIINRPRPKPAPAETDEQEK